MLVSKMRIFDILGLLLIVGILKPTIGTIFESDGRVPGHLFVLGFANTSAEEIEAFDKEICETNGGPDAHDEHKKSQRLFERCESALHSEIMDAMREEKFSADVYHAEYCRRIPKFQNCMKNLTDSIKNCLDITRHENADIVYNVYGTIMDFMCEDMFNTPEFSGRDFDRCMVSNMPDLENCVNHTVGQYLHETIHNGAAVGGLGTLHLLIPDATKCGVIEKFQICTVNTLKSCSTSGPAHAAASFFTKVNKVITCDRFIKSEASPHPIINIMLITALTAISWQFAYKI